MKEFSLSAPFKSYPWNCLVECNALVRSRFELLVIIDVKGC